ncbi:hypothetical protein BJ138DRAFT_647908 [Hygrophoropsis aurantiaca]|uniref:Uncharacterized protein n=1 Tax=Hygrophoropsis aurantiaca TaxID=72124 RepID=A0ACB8AJF6_9AGAM|nr:hypothetical protein BJ138DRAFT_647908 [Hygrophoropsis aurantiaca]
MRAKTSRALRNPGTLKWDMNQKRQHLSFKPHSKPNGLSGAHIPLKFAYGGMNQTLMAINSTPHPLGMGILIFSVSAYLSRALWLESPQRLALWRSARGSVLMMMLVLLLLRRAPLMMLMMLLKSHPMHPPPRPRRTIRGSLSLVRSRRRSRSNSDAKTLENTILQTKKRQVDMGNLPHHRIRVPFETLCSGNLGLGRLGGRWVWLRMHR